MHLAERRGGRGLQVEIGETIAPVWPKFGLHAPTHERGAHWRRLRLELGQFGGEIGRHRIGDGGQHLRHLHQWALHRAQGGRERLGVCLAPAPAQPIDADLGGERAGVDAEARITGSPRAQAIGFVVLIQTKFPRRRSAKMKYRRRVDQFQPPGRNVAKSQFFPRAARVNSAMPGGREPCPSTQGGAIRRPT